MSDETSDETRGRAPTVQEIGSGRRNIARQHMTIALSIAEAPVPDDESPGRHDGAIRAHLTAALAMLDETLGASGA